MWKLWNISHTSQRSHQTWPNVLHQWDSRNFQLYQKKTHKLRHFWQTIENVGCLTHLFNNLSVFLQIATHRESHYSYFVNKEAWIWQIRLNSWKFYPRSKIFYKSAICDKFQVCISYSLFSRTLLIICVPYTSTLYCPGWLNICILIQQS